MPINKILANFDEAVADISDGATVMVGGFATVASCPSFLLQALARKGAKNLTVISNTGGFGPDIWAIQGYEVTEDIDILMRNGQVAKAIVSAPSSMLLENNLQRQINAGEVEVEKSPLGTLTERIRSAKAGIGAFYVPVGAGTVVQEGKETRLIDGRVHLLEYAIHADFALIKAHKADRWGNLVYRKATRTVNETMAGAAKVTIVEVDEIVGLGELDPEAIVTPGVYIDRVVKRPQNTDESKTTDEKEIDPRFTESHQKFMETWKGRPKKEGQRG